jgi:hypothetical protein
MPDRYETYTNQYFTGSQASIFVENIWIDEVYGVQVFANQSIVPVYGYASTFFDMVGRGKVMIQGMFEINFVDEGYLYAVMADIYKRTHPSPEESTTEGQTITPRTKKMFDHLKLLWEINESEKSTTNDSAKRDRNHRDTYAAVIDLLSDSSIVEVDQLARKLKSNPPEVRSKNRTDLDLTINQNYRGLNLMYGMIPFNLKGYFGHPELGATDQGAFKELRDCFLVSNEIVISATDEPIRERYSFISRMHI